MNATLVRSLLSSAAVFVSMAGHALGQQVNVTAIIEGQGSLQIGTITVNPTGPQGFIYAEFALWPEFAYLDGCYDFQWVNILTGYTTDGVNNDDNNDGNPDHPLLGELPAIDPAPAGATPPPPPVFADGEPFYWTATQFAGFHVEGVSSTWADNRSFPAGTPGVRVLTFRTYLVAKNLSDPNLPLTTFCPLAGFEWTSTIDNGAPSVEAFVGVIPTSAANVAQVNAAIGQAHAPGFPGWTAMNDCHLCCGFPSSLSCPPDVTEIWDCINPPPAQTHPDHTGFATFVDGCCRDGAVLTYSDVSVPGTQPGDPEVVVTRTWHLTTNCNETLECDQVITLLSPGGACYPLTLDLMPSQCPNVITLGTDSAIDVVLVSTWLCDATTVMPIGLKMLRTDGVGRAIKLGGLPKVFADLTTPFYGPATECHTIAGDGYVDTVISVPRWMINRAFRLGELPPGSTVELALTGSLADGTAFDVRDCLSVP